MHAMTMVHRTLSMCCPSIHAKRLSALCDAAQAAATGNHLSLSELGRELSGPASIKHNIKRVDRLLGNTALHAELPQLYQALAQHYLAHAPMPLILIDWSDLTPDRHWQWLRASVALSGRSITLYEQVHPLSQSNTPSVHAAFLRQLATMLPLGCIPILVTDAGFRGTWFNLVSRMGWHWVGRIRNRDMVRPVGRSDWVGCKTLYAQADTAAKALGAYEYVRSRPVQCRLVLVKRTPKERHNRSVHGKPVCASRSLKQARCQREPWLLAVCPALAYLSADAVISLYAQRMQIEESFRDSKNERLGLGLSASRSRSRERIGVLLLIAAIASFMLRLIGEIAKHGHLERQCQSNTRTDRAVLSVITLARQLIRKRAADFTSAALNVALRYIQRCCAVPAF
jgi:hypothetical protein